MMEVRFLQDYQGQHTGPHFYQAGQVVELKDSAALALIRDGRAEEVVIWPPPEAEPQVIIEPPDPMEAMTMTELRQLAEDIGALTARSKADIIANIRQAQQQD